MPHNHYLGKILSETYGFHYVYWIALTFGWKSSRLELSSAQWFHVWLATKCALLIYAVIHQGAFFMIENPMTSLVGILIHCRASCVQKSNMMDRIQLLNYLWWFVPCWCWVTMASPTGYPLWTPEHLRQLYLAGWIWIFPNGYTQANSSLE